MNPKLKIVRFNCYLTVFQKELLAKISKDTRRPKTDVVRQAVHYFLQDRGLDDGLIFDKRNFLREYKRARGWEEAPIKLKLE